MIFGLFVLLACAGSAAANPTLEGTGFAPPEFTALTGEALVVSILLRPKGFRPLRTLLTWLFVTLGTYGILVWCISWVTDILPESLSALIRIAAPLIILELACIFLETSIIRHLSVRKSFRKSGTPLSWKTALLVSAAGNATSLVIGFLWILAGESLPIF